MGVHCIEKSGVSAAVKKTIIIFRIDIIIEPSAVVYIGIPSMPLMLVDIVMPPEAVEEAMSMLIVIEAMFMTANEWNRPEEDQEASAERFVVCVPPLVYA